MARTISAIKLQMTSSFMHNVDVRRIYDIPSNIQDDQFDNYFSKVSIESILFYIIAFAIFTYESIFDTNSASLTSYIDSKRPHTLKWYSDILKRFQLSDSLPEDSEVYQVIDETKQIVKQCNVRESVGRLKCKIAKAGSNNSLTNLTPEELEAVTTYAKRIKDAGVRLEIVSYPADIIRIDAIIHYDPLVLRADGTKISDNSQPIKTSIKDHLNALPFDSVFSRMSLVDAIQQTEGVKVAEITLCRAKPAGDIYYDVESIYIPDSGYMVLDDSLTTLNYIAY